MVIDNQSRRDIRQLYIQNFKRCIHVRPKYYICMMSGLPLKKKKEWNNLRF
jgi:hypothetical protein